MQSVWLWQRPQEGPNAQCSRSRGQTGLAAQEGKCGKGGAVAGKTELAITQQRALEKEMATHFSILAWENSCLHGQRSWQATVHEGLERVGRDLVPKQRKRTKQWQRTSVTRAAS